ncbi:thermonuclease family protein [Oryzicola mucosus]|uniref:Thermonuclease family protein n=1 Tax=Oryzicola mucosus TaxID=2767425 RepID=A0A8J6PMN2_9HYPH|nr:thermonuclease family protein [Oryzicola mucosus]MBD0416151.1 thermonuclease family protein [Oryzicola mucosus]
MSRFRFTSAKPTKRRRFLDYALAAAVLFMTGVVVLRLNEAAKQTLAGAVDVNDGDSLTVKGARIRLWGLDAPELNQICARDGRDYPCGRMARETLKDMIGTASIRCEGWEHDRYGRLLAECWNGQANLNRDLVRKGWAVSYGGYEAEEAAARQDLAGLWSGDFDRPRDWRSHHGGMTEEYHGLYERIANWLRGIFRISNMQGATT